MIARISILAIALCTLSTHAFAQRTNVRSNGFRNVDVVDDTLNRKGRFELSLNVAGALSFGSSTPEGGESVGSTNIYLTASAVLGYMLLDNLELRLAAGMQYLGDSSGDNSDNRPGFVGAVQALYQRDLILGLALYAGLGAGGFYGSRTVPAGASLEERLTSTGFLGQVLAGVLVMPGPRLLLRGGVRGDFLIGSESSNAEGSSRPSASFFTTQIVFDVTIGLRFG